MEETMFNKLRSCFIAGYTLPQYCIDNEIRKPLFVTYKKFWQLSMEIYVQFQYDKRLTAQFSFLDSPKEEIKDVPLDFIIPPLISENLTEELIVDCDKIFFLTSQKFDIVSNKIIYFDELLNQMYLRTYAEIPLLNFLQRNPLVKLIVVNFPALPKNEYTTAREKKLLEEDGLNLLFRIREKIGKNPQTHIPTPYDFLGYTNQEVYDLLECPVVKTNADGFSSLEDNDNKFLGIKDGKRLTAYQPKNYSNSIYFVGNCIYFGFGVPFQKTVESELQKLLNEKNLPWRVENASQVIDRRFQDIFYKLNELPVKNGDIIFCCPQIFVPYQLPFFDTQKFFVRPHNYGEVFADSSHINELGHRALAEIFFNLLTANNFFRDKDFIYNTPPPSSLSSLRHSSAIRGGRRKKFRQRGAGAVQTKTSCEKNSDRRNRHELQPVHARSSLSCRICGGKSCQALYFRRRGRSQRISLRRPI